MSADAPRATAEDGFTPGDDLGEGSAEGPTEPSAGSDSSTPRAPSGVDPAGDTATWADPLGGPHGGTGGPGGPGGLGAPLGPGDAAAEDAGDPAEFAEPGAGGRGGGDPSAGSAPEPELPNFVGRARRDGDGDGDPNGHSPGVPFTAPGGPAAPGPDGIPPAPTLEPGAVPGPGVPPPAHLRSTPGEPPSPGPLGSPALRVPKLPRVPNLRNLPGLRRRGEHERRSGRAKGLRVNQRLWRVDPWSVFKISALFYLCVFLVLMVAGTLLWNFGRSTGTIDDFESFVARLGAYGECVPEDEVPEGTDFESDDDCPDGRVRAIQFELDDGTIFRSALVGGMVLVVAGSVGNVLMTVLLNLINEVSGGARYTIIKEPTPRPPGSPRPGGASGPGGAAPPGPPDGSTKAGLRR